MTLQEHSSEDYKRLVQADEHALRHLAWYLKAANQIERLKFLLAGTRSWLDAKAERFGTDTEYMEDLAVAIGTPETRVVDENELVFLTSLHAARLLVFSRINRLTYDAVEAMVWLGRETEAIRITRLRPRSISGEIISGQRTGMRGTASIEGQAVLGLMRIYAAGYERDKRLSPWLSELQKEILTLLRAATAKDRDEAVPEFIKVLMQTRQYDVADLLYETTESDFHKEFLAQDLIRGYADAGQYSRANALIGGLDADHREEAFETMSASYARAGQFEESKKMMDLIATGWRKAWPRRCLAVAYSRVGNFREAEAILSELNQNEVKVSDMCEFASSAFAFGDLARVDSWVQVISRAIPEIPEIYDWSSAEEQRSSACLQYARLLKDLGRDDECRFALRQAADYAFICPSSHEVEQATAAWLNTLGGLGYRDELVSALHKTPWYLRGWFQANATSAAAYAGHYEVAEALAHSIGSAMERHHALLALAVVKAKAGRLKDAAGHFDDAIEASKGSQDQSRLIKTLCSMSRALFKVGHASASSLLSLAMEHFRSARQKIETPQTVNEPVSWAFSSHGVADHLNSETTLIALELVCQGRITELLEFVRSNSSRFSGPYFSVEESSEIKGTMLRLKERLSVEERDALLKFFRIDSTSPMFCYEVKDVPAYERISLLKARLSTEMHSESDSAQGILSDLIDNMAAAGDLDEAESLLFANRSRLDEYQFAACSRTFVQQLLKTGHLPRAVSYLHSLIRQVAEDYHWRRAVCSVREELARYYIKEGRFEEIPTLNSTESPSYEEGELTCAIIAALAEQGSIELAESLLKGDAGKALDTDKRQTSLLNIARAAAYKGDVEKVVLLIQQVLHTALARKSGFGAHPEVESVLDTASDLGMFGLVLSNHPFEMMEEFVEMVSGWVPGLQLQFGSEAQSLQAALIQEIVRIASWEHPQWIKIHELLSR